MQLQNTSQSSPKRAGHSGPARLAIAILASLTLLIAQALPSIAAAQNGSGEWIEICSNGAIALVQVDDKDSPAPSSQCSHCPFCLVPFNSMAGVLSQPTLPTPALTGTIFTFSEREAEFVSAPEQYWSANRGPPRNNMEKNMKTTNRSIPVYAQVSLISSTWGFPCL